MSGFHQFLAAKPLVAVSDPLRSLASTCRTNRMNDVEAYEYLNARFVEFAEVHQRPVSPVFGRRSGVAEMGSPSFFEICADRWFSITNENSPLDAQWNGLRDPAHMQIFADLSAHPFEVFWKLRCVWFNFESGVDLEQAEERVLEIVRGTVAIDAKA